MSKPKTATEKALVLFSQRGGLLRTSQALAEGVHPMTLYKLRNDGLLNKWIEAYTDSPVQTVKSTQNWHR